MLKNLVSLRTAFLISFLSFFFFLYGCGVGRYKWFPFHLIQETMSLLNKCEKYPYSEGCVEKIDVKERLLNTDEFSFASSEVNQVNLNPLDERNKLIDRVILPRNLVSINKSTDSKNRSCA